MSSELVETLRAACLERGAAGIHGIGRYVFILVSIKRKEKHFRFHFRFRNENRSEVYYTQVLFPQRCTMRGDA